MNKDNSLNTSKNIQLKSPRNIRHDLKSPLAVISGYAQLIMKKQENTNSKEEKWSKEIYTQVIRMVDMINDLIKD